MQEFYIRKNEETDARGPFTVEQLQSLVEAGQVDPETYYYDVDQEQWVQILGNDPLRTALFPEKKRLKLKPKENVQSLNAPAPGTPAAAQKAITVDEMLAAAEGKTPDSAGRRDPTIARAFAANISLKLATGTAFVMVAALATALGDALFAADLGILLGRPLFYVTVIDLLIGMILVLAVVEAYPFVRFRGMAGATFLAVYFLNAGNPTAAACAVASGVGLFILTLAVHLPVAILGGLLGIGGAGALLWALSSGI